MDHRCRTVANGTVLLLELNWGGFGLSGAVWSMVMLVAATLIASGMLLYSRAGLGTVAYLSVIVWALIGVNVGNMPKSDAVGMTAIAMAVIVVLVAAYHLFSNRPQYAEIQRPTPQSA